MSGELKLSLIASTNHNETERMQVEYFFSKDRAEIHKEASSVYKTVSKTVCKFFNIEDKWDKNCSKQFCTKTPIHSIDFIYTKKILAYVAISLFKERRDFLCET